VEEKEKRAIDWSVLQHDWFQDQLTHFLFSPRGAKYRLNFQFQDELQCGKPAPRSHSISQQ
jgi:hypothetical protein